MSRAADRAERLLRELGPEGAAREDLYDRLRAFDTPGYGLRELASEDTRELLAALSGRARNGDLAADAAVAGLLGGAMEQAPLKGLLRLSPQEVRSRGDVLDIEDIRVTAAIQWVGPLAELPHRAAGPARDLLDRLGTVLERKDSEGFERFEAAMATGEPADRAIVVAAGREGPARDNVATAAKAATVPAPKTSRSLPRAVRPAEPPRPQR